MNMMRIREGWGSVSEVAVIRTACLMVNLAGLVLVVMLGRMTPDLLAGSVPVFRRQFIEQDGVGFLLSFAILFVTFFWCLSDDVARAIGRFFSRRRGFVAGLVLVLLCIGSAWIYRGYPLSMDEYSMLFQAKVFSMGDLSVSYPPRMIRWLFTPAELDRFFAVSPIDGRTISHYWPGFSLLSAPFVRLRVVWLLNPLLAAGSLLLLWKIARDVFDSSAGAGLAVLFAVASPAFSINAISLFAMNAHLFFNLAFVALLLRPTPARLLAAGTVGSIAVILHNPLPHFLFALPWIVRIAVGRRRFRDLALLGAGYLPLTVGVGVAWVVFRGVVGGAGVPTSWAETLWRIIERGRWLAFPSVSTLSIQCIYILKLCSWAIPGLVPLAVLGAWRWWAHPVIRTLTASAVLTMAAYVFVPFNQGHGWGYRYFHPVWGILPLFAVAALMIPGDHRRFGSLRPGLAGFAVTTALMSLAAGTAMRTIQVDHFIDHRLARRPVAPKEGCAVCFVDLRNGRPAGELVKNDPFQRERVVYLRSHGPEADRRFVGSTVPSARLVWRGPAGSCWTVEDPMDLRRTGPVSLRGGRSGVVSGPGDDY